MLVLGAFVAVAACSRANPEDVQVAIEKDKLVVVNKSGEDIYYQITAARNLQAWIPVSLETIRIRRDERRRFDLDLDDRGLRESGFAFNWWHRGELIGDSGFHGPDRVRKVVFDSAKLATLLPALPDPAAVADTEHRMLEACRERVVLEAWMARRVNGTEAEETPPDAPGQPMPSACQDLLRDCRALKTCDTNRVAQQQRLDEARGQAGFKPADYVTSFRAADALPGAVVGSRRGVPSAGQPARTAPTTDGVVQASASIPDTNGALLAVCREREMLDAWERSTASGSGERPAPPDFAGAPVPWSCRDLVRDCEAGKRCPEVLAAQKALLDQTRARTIR